MKKIEVDELKKIELCILDTFDVFCKEKGLSYSLATGTLLGAIRHKGFIPWDDDIDVLMPRNDYDKLLELEADFPKPYSVNSYQINGERDKPYIYTYIKITDDRTSMIELPGILDFKTSVYVDVFPLDGLPKEKDLIIERYREARKLINKGYSRNAAIYHARAIKNYNPKAFAKKIYYYINDFLRRCEPNNYYFKKLDDFVKEWDVQSSDFVGTIAAGYGEREALPREVFFPLGRVEFEGKLYSVMHDPDYYLQSLYGDYMKLPPEEERKAVHNNVSWWID